MPPADGSPGDDPLSLRELAGDLVRSAGSVALEGRRAARDRGAFDSTTKSTLTDVVTEFDRAAEVAIVETIRRLRPNDAIVGEEGTSVGGTSGYAWYIDPIDGTTSFVYDLPTWSCSIGVARDDAMVAGAVYLPALDELFDAARGHGARLDGRPIAVSGEVELGLALVGTGFSYDRSQRIAQARRLAGMIGEIRDVRRTGSAAVDLCFVAAGRLDVYYEQYLNAWDAAAGLLIAEEAGAAASDFGGGSPRPAQLVVATPGVHRAFLDLLAAAEPA
jgi:myo-inositol-1(or 4)-monophosphatase